MAIYNSNKVGATPKYLDPAAGVNSIATYSWIAASNPTLTLGDTIVFMPIPAGVFMMDIGLDVDKLDGAGTTLTLSVGDASNPARYMSGITIGRAGGYATSNVNGWTGYSYAATTYLIATVTATAGGAVPTNAGVRLFISYTADP